MRCIKTILAGLIIVSACVAQNINISGKVTDTGTTPLAGAVVLLEKGGLTDTTGADGLFAITGIVGINFHINQTLPHKLSATIHNGLLSVNVPERSAVEICTYTVQGKVVYKIQQTMDAGTHSIALPRMGAGVYFYQIKSGNNEFLMKSHSIGAVSGGTTVSHRGVSTAGLTRLTRSYAPIDDVIAVTKDGYLNYRVIVTNSDTSGIEIKMIVCAGTVTDADGNVYQTVKIGNQEWMAENLRTTKYNDGTIIPLVTDSAAWVALITPGYCYYNNTSNAESIKKFGALYNWYVVNPANPKKVAPAGWHVPDTTDWNTLENYLIANGYNWDGTTTGNKIAKSMAAKADWLSNTTAGTIGNNLRANNRSGFLALPGGFRDFNGNFYTIGDSGAWWSATEYDASCAYFRSLVYYSGSPNRLNNSKGLGFSVRLLRDTN